MKKIILNVVLALGAIALIIGCSSNSSDSPSISSIYGTYNMTSLTPSLAIDSDGNGTYETTDLVSVIGCDFTIALFEGDTFSLNYYFSLSQSSSCCNPDGTPISVSPINCFPQAISGTLNITNGSILFIPTNDGTGTQEQIGGLSGDEIAITTTEFFYTEVGGVVQQRSVQFTATFTKQ